MGTATPTKRRVSTKSGAAKKSPATPRKKEVAPMTQEITERPLQPVEEEDIQISIKRGYKYLKLDPRKTSAEKAQAAIAHALDEVFLSNKKPTPKAIEDLAMNLGSLWGQTICDSLGWEWGYVTLDENGAYAVVSPNRSHMVAPMDFILEQLQNQSAEENTSLILYKMLKAGSLMKAKPRSYVLVG
jgi:hypothetical protein